jgi:TetR/AcrR family transcriptional regulator, transcriptional repressor for nem operon
MGRAKIFDETAALSKAMRLFWRQGYANTSIKQLLTEMDMLNGSFYHSFKDKKTVFLKSLNYYNQEITHKRQAALAEHDDFSIGIRALFTEVFKTLDSKDEPNGCLVVNSMATEVLSIEELKSVLFRDFELFVNFLTDKIQHSIDLGHTSTHLPAKQLAYILVTYIQGLFRISNINIDTKQLKSQTNDFLSALNV